jgi:hypothetical protein
MKNYRFFALFLLLAFTLPYTYGGCSGGGGGGSNDSGLTYTGETTAAEIDNDNAEEIAGGALGAGLVSDGMLGINAADASDAQRTGSARSVNVPLTLGNSLKAIYIPPPGPFSTQATYTDEETINGDCGGTMSYDIFIDDLAGTFEGNFTFSDYCSDGTTLDGSASFSGTMNVESSEFIEATFTFDNLSGDDLTLDGTIFIDFTGTPDVLTFNGYTQDPVTEKVCRIKNYVITIDDSNAGYVETEMSGTFYFPDYGYVTLSTPETLMIFDGDEWPYSGILVVEGKDNTKAKITAINELTCTVEADVDGDDDYEWDSGVMDWEDL